MSKLKWLKLLFVIPLLGLLVITNVYEDPANIYHDESKSIAAAIADGKAAYSGIGFGNGNEREIKHNLIMIMPDETDCIAVGPSLVMCVNKDIVGTDNFINLGVSAADIYDILAQFGLMDIYDPAKRDFINGYERNVWIEFGKEPYFIADKAWGVGDFDYTSIANRRFVGRGCH